MMIAIVALLMVGCYFAGAFMQALRELETRNRKQGDASGCLALITIAGMLASYILFAWKFA